MEEALRNNQEYFTDKLRVETALQSLKGKKGFFNDFARKLGERKLKKISAKPPKKLDQSGRQDLEKMLANDKNEELFYERVTRPFMIQILGKTTDSSEEK